jgi:cation:H+ antiporter
MDYLFIIGGLVLLVFGGDWLLKAAVGMSLRLNISKIIIGMTVVSFATSAPELIVSVQSALNGFPDIALGNVVGSNIANIGLILGVVALISAMPVDTTFFKIDMPAVIVSSLLITGILFYDGQIDRWEGAVMFALLITFIVFLIRNQRKSKNEIELPEEKVMSMPWVMFFLTIGGIALYFGSDLLIKGAVNVAETFGVSDRVIAVTVVAIGTSIPELAASLIAAVKKESSISIGNVLGSNIFNILSVLGLTAMIQPVKVIDQRLLTFDIFWMLGFAFILLFLAFMPKRGFIDRRAGIILLLAYGTFIYLTFV